MIRSRLWAGACLGAAWALAVASAGATAGESPAPSAATVDKTATVAPLVQPSIVYLDIAYTGYVWDAFVKDFVGPLDASGQAELKQFTHRTRCTGFVVNPDGWIGTAEHCVNMARGKIGLRREAITWALNNNYYDLEALRQAAELENLTPFRYLDQYQTYVTYTVEEIEGSQEPRRNTADRLVTVSSASAVSGVDIVESTPAQVEAQDKEGDVALLKVHEDGLNALPLAEDDVTINAQVQSVGYPAIIDGFTDADMVPTFNPGTVSSTNKTVENNLLPVLQLSAPMSGGMSGGPTVNLDGEVVGVNSAGYPGEAFNYAVPADNLERLMRDAGVANELSPATRAYRAGIQALLAGDKTVAVRELSAVVEEQPANGMAAEQLRLARSLPDPAPAAPAPTEPGAAGTQWLWWALGGAVLLLLLLVAGGWWLLRRGRTVPTLAPSPPAAAPAPVAATAAGPGFVSPAPTATATGAPGASWDMASRPPSEATTPVGFSAHPAAPQEAPQATEPAADPSVTGGAAPQALALGRRFCTNCGGEAHPGARFCGDCGSPLTPPDGGPPANR